MFDKIKACQEIEQRNRLRAEANLPLVSVAEELVRYEKVAAQKEYRDFLSSPLRERVREKLLNRIRRRSKNPDWRPTSFMSAYAFNVTVGNRMRRIWRWRTEKGHR